MKLLTDLVKICSFCCYYPFLHIFSLLIKISRSFTPGYFCLPVFQTIIVLFSIIILLFFSCFFGSQTFSYSFSVFLLWLSRIFL